MKKIIIIFILFCFSENVLAIDINKSISLRNQFFDLEETLKLVSVLDNVYKNNSFKFRSSGKETFFSKYADGIVAIFTDNSNGSGAVINEEGYAVTNWHVIEGFDEVSVVFKPPSGSAVTPTAIHKAEVIMIDKERDLALLKPLFPPKNLTVLKIPNDFEFTENYLISNDAHCIGHPQGYSWSYTKGIVSQIRPKEQWSYYTEKIQSGDNLTSEEENYELENSIWHIADVIQIDCSINPGNSGGPLLNSNGELLGINSNYEVGSQNLNFAIAANEVKSFLNGEIYEPITALEYQEITKEPTILKEIDYNEDGNIDTYWMDYSGNFIADTYLIDEDFNINTGDEYGIDFVLIDDDENDIYEAKWYWEDETKYEEFDIEQDGTFDIIMIDYDSDGNYDVIKRI